MTFLFRSLKKILPLDIVEKVDRRIHKIVKPIRQAPYYFHPAQSSFPVFLTGCQRTGTTTFARVLDQSVHSTVYKEGNPKAFDGFHLKPPEEIQPLIKNNRTPLIIFDVKVDAQDSRKFLDTYPASKTIWIYRNYKDTAKIAALRWGTHFKDVMRWIKHGEWENLAWRGKNLSQREITLASDLYHEGLSAEDGAAFFWYIRNQFFFSLKLHEDERARLLNYEQYVSTPMEVIPPIFDFINQPFHEKFVRALSPRFIENYAFPDIDKNIQSLCETLMKKLEDTNTRS